MNLFDFVPGYEDRIYETGREPILVTLVAFLIAFALTRTYTRLARIRGWRSGSAGGVHVHHVLVGILLVLGSGIMLIGFQPEEGFWELLLCAAFGVGAAFILDEFALVFRLEDVYWRDEGRSSIDAVAIAVVVSGLVLLHVVPFDEREAAGGWELVAYVASDLAVVVISVIKGKLMTGLLGAFVPGLAVVGAVRLAKPTSPWARRFYPAGSRRRERAEARSSDIGGVGITDAAASRIWWAERPGPSARGHAVPARGCWRGQRETSRPNPTRRLRRPPPEPASVDRREDPARDARPAPALDGSPAGSRTKRGALVLGEAENTLESLA